MPHFVFELGVQVQVLRRGDMFATRAQRLYDLYRAYDGIDAIPAEVRADLEATLFRCPLQTVWQDCMALFTERDPAQLVSAERDPKARMALIFRWYLGLEHSW
ncbi:hypothetical protein [Nocardia sp. NPDC059239]|uniref:hypothetical protein n=1 Tax=Nocardia sp. NPDC059239 TaxID=3346785 RepID=UPI0036BD3805